MEIILSKHCTNFSGSINKSYGYSVCRRGKRFFSVRNANRHVPDDGHIRFILTCADIAQDGVWFRDIAVPQQEFIDALREAGMRKDADYYTLHPEELTPCTSRASLREPQKKTLNAKQVLDFAEEHKLEEVLK